MKGLGDQFAEVAQQGVDLQMADAGYRGERQRGVGDPRSDAVRFGLVVPGHGQGDLLDFDRQVVGYASQPLWLFWPETTAVGARRWRSHAPDFFARRGAADRLPSGRADQAA